jgi:hypothetical protein
MARQKAREQRARRARVTDVQPLALTETILKCENTTESSAPLPNHLFSGPHLLKVLSPFNIHTGDQASSTWNFGNISYKNNSRHKILQFSFFFIIHLFICAFIIWVISPPCPFPPLFQASPTLPLSLVLLKKRDKPNIIRKTKCFC